MLRVNRRRPVWIPVGLRSRGVGSFRQLFSTHVASAWARQVEFGRFLDGRSWAVDIDTGLATFGGDLTFPIQLLGSEADEENTWLWAWANVDSELPGQLLQLVTWVREYGREHEISELIVDSLSLAKIQGHDLAMVCGGLAGGLPYYRGSYAGGALFFAVERPPSEVVAPLPPERIPTVLSEVLARFELDHRIAVENFLSQQGYQVVDHGSQLTGTRPDGSSCHMEFDDVGRLSRIDLKLTPPSHG